MSSGKIVVFTPGLHAFGGVERLLLDLSRFLHDEKRPHTILCLSRSIDLAAHADWPMEVKALEPARNPLAEARALAGFFREQGRGANRTPLFFDLKSAFYAGIAGCGSFHLHLTDPPSLLPRDVSKFAPSLRARFPARAGLLNALRGEAVHRINRRGVLRARSLIAMTHVIADELNWLYGRKAMVIRPGVALPPSRDATVTNANGRVRFLSVSRLEESKRIDWILQVLAELERSGSPLSAQLDWVLDIVGGGSQEQALRDLAASLGIGDRVIFHGRLSDEGLESLFAQAGLFLMPAVQGYGLPALEALIRGVPVILHRQSGVSEVIDSPPWVETIEHGREDLLAAIRRMAVSIASGALQRQAAPSVPTAPQWARNIATACGWL